MLTTLLLSAILELPTGVSHIGLREVGSLHQLEHTNSGTSKVLYRQRGSINDWHLLSDHSHILVDQFPTYVVVRLSDGTARPVTGIVRDARTLLLKADSMGHFYVARSHSYRKVELFRVDTDGVATSLCYVLVADTSKPRQAGIVYEEPSPEAIMPYTDVWYQVMHVVPPLRSLLRPELLYQFDDSPPPFVRFASMSYGGGSDSISPSPPMGFRYHRRSGEIFRILPGGRPEQVHKIRPLTWLVHFEARDGLLSLTYTESPYRPSGAHGQQIEGPFHSLIIDGTTGKVVLKLSGYQKLKAYRTIQSNQGQISGVERYRD